MLSELLSLKIEKSKSNYILNWILIEVQFSAMCLSKFLIFVVSELLGVKTKEYKINYIYIYIMRTIITYFINV